MGTAEVKSLIEQHTINTYGPRSIAFVRGEGAKLWDAEGKEYLDFFAGVAVVSLGHSNPAVSKTICDQAKTLMHVSNLYLTQPQAELAALLCKHSFADRWFFCNCGATAIEAAIKLSRRYWALQGTPKPELVAMNQSFHGRTLATITATGQPKYKEGFEPLLPGIHHVPFNDIDALKAAVTPNVGAIIMELIQGEGGVNVASESYVKAVRTLCTERSVLLIFDEVQTGMGRTGKLFAYEHYGVTPDVICLAKALGNGLPIGAMGCTERVSTGFSPGMHATTFGGNPLCAATAKTVLGMMTEPGFLEHVTAIGASFKSKLESLARKHANLKEVRGKGLIIGVEFNEPVAPIVQKMLERGVVCGPAGPNVLRFVPPLIITDVDVDKVVGILEDVLGAV